MIATTDIAIALARLANDFAMPDVPRDPELIVGTDVPDELVAMAAMHAATSV